MKENDIGIWLLSEFDHQVDTLLKKGYPKLAGLNETGFLRQIAPLREKILDMARVAEPEEGYIPFVIVIKQELVVAEKAMSVVDFHGQAGFINLSPIVIEKFQTIEKVTMPPSQAYLLVDIDRGKETLNIRPNEALKIILKENRSPLTIDEGLAIITHYPEFLKKNNCFSLLASRCGDQRVPAIWISDKKPRLGWCWDGNPHTWLGSASCRERIE